MIDQADPWDFCHEAMRHAGKDHRCGECGRTIARGERHHYLTGKSERYFTAWRTCEQCHEASRWLIVACSGYLLGAAEEDLAEHVTGEESYLRSAPLTRLLRWMLADWRTRTGDLRSVDDVHDVTERALVAYRAQYDQAVLA